MSEDPVLKELNEVLDELEKKLMQEEKGTTLKKEEATKFVQWQGQELMVGFNRYPSKQLAIGLFDPVDGELVIKGSVSVEEIEIPQNHVLIKNYSECDGMLEVLVKGGIVSEPIRVHRVGHAKVPECEVYPY